MVDFDVRLRLYKDDLTPDRVLNTSALEASLQYSDTGLVRFNLSEAVDNLPPDGRFLVGLEHVGPGGRYVLSRNGIFIVDAYDGDAADPAQMYQYSGELFVPFLLQGMHQRATAYTGATRKDGKSIWKNATPGRILTSLIQHGQEVDGWAPALSKDFGALTDSSGASWTDAERSTLEFETMTSIGDILDALVQNGLCDWWVEGGVDGGATLRVFRPGTGVDRPVQLGGPQFTATPIKSAWEEQFTYLTVIDDEGELHYYSNPGSDTSYGRYHQIVTMSGVKGDQVDKLVLPVLAEGRTPQREMSYEWTPRDEDPRPWADFNIGDGVMALTRGGWLKQRVLGVTVTKSGAGSPVKIRATVGSKLINRLKRAVTKVNRSTGGGKSRPAGTGKPVPIKKPVPLPLPKAPTGLRVVSNTADWGNDGKALTRVQLAWVEVTQSMDASEIDIAGYEVWSHEGPQAPARDTRTESLEYTAEGWRSEVIRFVKVCAVDTQGRRGAFSDEIPVVPVTPASIIPKAPTGLQVTANAGRFNVDNTSVSDLSVSWNEVTLSTDNTPVDIRAYLLRIAHLTDGAVDYTDELRVRGTTASFSIPAGRDVRVTVLAETTLGIVGDPSDPVNATGALPANVLIAPSVPILTSGFGSVHARWDGAWAGGAPGPNGTAYVITETAPAAAGPWAIAGTPLARAGGNMIPAPATGEAVWVRFYATDALGRTGPYSAVASITVAGIDLGSIPGLEGALDDIRYTADGKNRIFVSHAEPAEADHAVGDLWLQLDEAETSVVSILVWDGDEWVPQILYAEHIVAAESITGQLVRAGTLEVNNVSPTFGDDLNLSANEAVTIIVGRQNDHDGQLSNMGESIDNVTLAVDEVSGTAQDALSTAGAAVDAADAAQAAADEASDRLDEHQTYYRFSTDGLSIGDPDSAAELRLTPERIEMTQNDVVVSYWEGGTFVADEARLTSVQVGNHQFTAYGNGRTIVRPL